MRKTLSVDLKNSRLDHVMKLASTDLFFNAQQLKALPDMVLQDLFSRRLSLSPLVLFYIGPWG